MLIGTNGEKHGLVSFSKALGMAKESSLDLVQVSPKESNPVVCKLLDYGKHLFDKKKSKSSSKAKVKKTPLKKSNSDPRQIRVTIILN